jgi:hypothetical protein
MKSLRDIISFSGPHRLYPILGSTELRRRVKPAAVDRLRIGIKRKLMEL